MYTVIIKFEQQGLAPVKIEKAEAGQSLLELAMIHNVALHHQCGGVCSCTTCQVFIEKGMNFIDEMSMKEQHFIKRASHSRLNSRLGCQCLLLEGHGRIELIIPDQAEVVPL